MTKMRSVSTRMDRSLVLARMVSQEMAQFVLVNKRLMISKILICVVSNILSNAISY